MLKWYFTLVEIVYNDSSDNSILTGNHNLTHYPDNPPLRCYKFLYSFVIFPIFMIFAKYLYKRLKRLSIFLYISFNGVITSKLHRSFWNKAEAMVMSLMTLTSVLWSGSEWGPEVDLFVSVEVQSCSLQSSSQLCLENQLNV